MMDTHALGRYAYINRHVLDYEIHGTGMPLVLLAGSTAKVDSILWPLAETWRVIVVEQGQGLSAEQMSDDTAALLRHLEIERADFAGYGAGYEVVLQVALRHPKLLRKIVVAIPDPSRFDQLSRSFPAL